MRAITLVTLLCASAVAFGVAHDLTLGQVTYGDVLLYSHNKYKYGFPLFVRDSIVDYPPEGHESRAVIRAIIIKDHEKPGEGGYATVKAGGVGQRFVSLKLKSQRGNGFNFTIKIYGRFLF